MMGCQQFLPGCGLEGRKAEPALFILPDHEIDGSVAEVAGAVEENDGGGRHKVDVGACRLHAAIANYETLSVRLRPAPACPPALVRPGPALLPVPPWLSAPIPLPRSAV